MFPFEEAIIVNRLLQIRSRETSLRLVCVILAVWTASTPCRAVLADLEKDPPSVPADWSHARELDEAGRKFIAWQKAMLQEREELSRKQWRHFHQQMKVPPPLPPSQSTDEPAMTRLDIPLPLPTDLQLSLSMGKPSASFNVGVEGKALSFVGASYEAGVSYAAADNKWLVGDALDFKAALEAGPATATGTYQFHSSTWGELREDGGGDKLQGGLDLSAEIWKIKGAVGYNTQNELSVAAGYDFVKTPKTWSKLAEVSVGVEGQVSAPVKVHGLTRGSRTLSSTIANYSAKVAKLLTSPVDCPYCSAKGELDCATCKNTRTVTCTKCNGKLQFPCPTCEGGGELICTTCNQTGIESCSRCSGSGSLKCYTCGGDGQVTVYESEIQSRQELVVDQIGFDDAGNPVYNRHYETRYYTVQVPKSQTCSSCGGTGSGGECGTCGGDGKVTCHRCGGSGTVACHRCGGDGQIACGKCRGTGKIPCPECRGKPIRCPLCKGKKELGQ